MLKTNPGVWWHFCPLKRVSVPAVMKIIFNFKISERYFSISNINFNHVMYFKLLSTFFADVLKMLKQRLCMFFYTSTVSGKIHILHASTEYPHAMQRLMDKKLLIFFLYKSLKIICNVSISAIGFFTHHFLQFFCGLCIKYLFFFGTRCC